MSEDEYVFEGIAVGSDEVTPPLVISESNAISIGFTTKYLSFVTFAHRHGVLIIFSD